MGKKRHIKQLVLLCTVCIICIWGRPTIAEAEISVKQGESIQKAIEQASDGDTILIQKGTYDESLTINKSITLKGEEDVTIDGQGKGNVVTIEASKVVIDGLKIQNSGTDTNDSGILLKSGTGNEVKNNTFENTMNGVYVENGTEYVIEGNEMSSYEEHFSNRGSGIYVLEGARLTISDNSMSNVQDGVYVESVTDTIIAKNTVSGSRYGIHLMFADNMEIEGNVVQSNITGLMIMDSKQVNVIDNQVVNHFHVRGFGILIYESEQLQLKGNEIVRNSTGLSLEKTVDVQIQRNNISGNQVGLEFIGKNENNVFTENNFIANVVQSKIANNEMQLDDGETGNYWDDYTSFDVTGDGIGEETYKAGSLYDQLLEKEPSWQFFFESPSIMLWSEAESLFPSMGVEVYDENPLIEPVQLEEQKEDAGSRNIGALIFGLSFLWFSILLVWLGRSYL